MIKKTSLKIIIIVINKGKDTFFVCAPKKKDIIP